MKEIIKRNSVLIAILVVGIFLRLYNFKELFLYTHDQDLAGWFVKDVIYNHHFRLIGQETSTQGIFIGGLFYYLLIPFYLLSRMDPIGGIFLVLILGIFTILSFNFVFSKIFDRRVGLVASLIYATSFYTVFNDREVVPTMPVMLWSVWFLWGVFLLIKGKQKIAYLLLGFLFAMTWHLNVALVLLLPIVVLAQMISKTKLKFKSLGVWVLTLLLFSLPFFVFELRHNFIQIRSVFSAFTTDQQDIVSGTDKFVRTVHLFSKDVHNLMWGDFGRFDYVFDLILLLGVFFLIVYRKKIGKKVAILFAAWPLMYLLFFSFYSKRLSEYYLNGLIVIVIGVFSVFVVSLTGKKQKLWSYLVIFGFVAINLLRFFNITINRSGYIERQAITKEIKRDSLTHNFPCVSVSYITDPGYDRGYRYFLWLNKVKLKPISDKVPVYTIVFPQKPIFKTDKDIGAIGLIYPEYEKYDRAIVEVTCAGEDFNSEEPMIGFTD